MPSLTTHTGQVGNGNQHGSGRAAEDNLYSGFGTEEVAPALLTEDLEFDEGFQVHSIECNELALTCNRN